MARAGNDYGWLDATAANSCEYLLPEILRLTAKVSPRRIIDIGCGNGALCGALASRDYEVVGVEQDARGVEVARAEHKSVRFHRGSVAEDPPEVGFDLAISTEVVEHLFAPEMLPRFAWKALKPDGVLIVTTPYHGYLKNVAIAATGHWDQHHTVHWTGGHIKFFSRATLTKLLTENGFEVQTFLGVGRAPYLWKSMVVVARRREG